MSNITHRSHESHSHLKHLKTQFTMRLLTYNLLSQIAIILLCYWVVESPKKVLVVKSIIVLFSILNFILILFFKSTLNKYKKLFNPQTFDTVLYGSFKNLVKPIFIISFSSYIILPMLYVVSTILLKRPATVGATILVLFGGVGWGLLCGTLSFVYAKEFVFKIGKFNNQFVQNDKLINKISLPALSLGMILIFVLGIYSYGVITSIYTKNSLEKSLAVNKSAFIDSYYKNQNQSTFDLYSSFSKGADLISQNYLILGTNGSVLGSSVYSFVDRKYESFIENNQKYSFDKLISSVMKRGDPEGTFIAMHNHIIYYGWFYYNEAAQNYLFAFADSNQFYQPLISFPIILILITFLFAGLFLIFSQMTLKKQTNSITNIASFMHNNLAQADFSTQVEIHSNDELGNIEQSLIVFLDENNELLKKAKNNFFLTLDATKTLTKHMNKVSEELSGVIFQLNGAKTEIKNIKDTSEAVKLNTQKEQNGVLEFAVEIGNITTGIKKTSGAVDSQRNSIEEILSTLNELTANITDISKSTETADDSAEKLHQVTTHTRTIVEKTSRNVNNMLASIDGVQSFTKTIQEIASQTNLLAMNAAIEAAHAGEKGKGFAVVAEEIRKLADKSNVEAQSVKKVLENIISNSKGTGNDMNLMCDSFDVIANETENVTGLISQVRTAMSEQQKGNNDILNSVKTISLGTQSLQQESTRLREAATGVREQSSIINENVISNGKSIEELIESLQLITNFFASLDLSIKNTHLRLSTAESFLTHVADRITELEKDFRKYRLREENQITSSSF